MEKALLYRAILPTTQPRNLYFIRLTTRSNSNGVRRVLAVCKTVSGNELLIEADELFDGEKYSYSGSRIYQA